MEAVQTPKKIARRKKSLLILPEMGGDGRLHSALRNLAAIVELGTFVNTPATYTTRRADQVVILFAPTRQHRQSN
jgi:hypothetical protein